MRNSCTWRARLGGLVVFAAAVIPPAPVDSADSGQIAVRARDSATGRGIRARIALSDPRGARGAETLVALAGAPLPLENGEQTLEVTAPGYAPLSTRLTGGPGKKLPVTVMLDPIVPPAELEPEAVRGQLQRGYTLVHGHVVDAEEGKPVQGAHVRVREVGVEAATNGDGYFSARVPLSSFPRLKGALPAITDVVVSAPGYKSTVIAESFLPDGQAVHFIVEMETGEGEVRRNERHKQAMDCSEMQVPPPDPAAEPSAALAPFGVTRDSGAEAIGVPSSIRVGFGCSCSSCSSVSVLSMQTYVKWGLDDEWIASWHGESLRAGSVAYRSYGSWYAVHPLNSNYDICSTTCCQVTDSSTTAATDAAVDGTNGVVLERGGAIFRSEYAAENNAWDDPNDGLSCTNTDRSCGNGNAGSPATSWPCLSDTVCTGRGCFGHGRGMCQWGTQRWAANQGKDWRWIVAHYYNNCGTPAGLRSANVGPGCLVYGAIGAKYNQLGNACGFLGMCTTDELPTPDGIGRFNHFQGASIYWTQDTGAHTIYGAIRDKWASLGWETFNGYPTTDETGTPDGVGRFNHFSGFGGHASIYWTPATGAHEVHGAIHERWAQMGWERSCLGYPVSDEYASGNGRRSDFQDGYIFWTPSTGAVSSC